MFFFRLGMMVGLLSWTLFGQAFDPGKDVQVTFSGGQVLLTVSPQGHLNQSFLNIALATQPGKLHMGPLPKESAKDEFGQGIYTGTVAIPLRGEGLSGLVGLEVTYQACSESPAYICFPPKTQKLQVPAKDIPALASPEDGSKPSQEEPLLWFLMMAFGFGVMASLTPCVFPMIPITMAILGAKRPKGEHGGMLRGLMLSLMLVLGMAVMYTGLGVITAKAGGQLGAFAQSPYFLVPASLVFAILAFSQFGLYEIQLPQALRDKLQGEGPRRGYGGAFITGLLLGPLAAPCAGPFVGTLMLAIGKQGRVALGAASFFAFSLGMGLLFVLAGTFSASLPRSGEWLNRVKTIMGTVILGFAVWNVRLLLPGWVNSGLWSLTLLVGAGALGAFDAAEGLAGQFRKGLALLALVIGLLCGVHSVESGLDLELLPRGGVAREKTSPGLEAPWILNDFEKAKTQAAQEGKFLLVDTFAEWCQACKELDHKTWPEASVAAWLRTKAVPVRIDTDAVRPDLRQVLDIRSYPTVILFDKAGKELKRDYGFKPPKDMLAWLEGVETVKK